MRLETDMKGLDKRLARLLAGVRNFAPVAREWAGGVVRRIKTSLLRVGKD